MKKLLLVFALGLVVAPAQNALYLDISRDWRRIAGDRLEYAQPGFDDRGWETVYLPKAVRRGSRVIWLRRAVDLPDGADRGRLALTIGSINDAYEVYVNGVPIGGTGGFTYDAWQLPRPRTFAIPEEAVRNSARLELAIRGIRLPRPSPPSWRDFNYVEGPFLLTYDFNAPKDAGRHSMNQRRLRHSPSLLFAVLEAIAALFILFVWAGDRQQSRFFWLGAFLLLESGGEILSTAVLRETSFPFGWPHFTTALMLVAAAPVYAEFAMSVLRLRARWFRTAVWSIWAAFALTLAFGRPDFPWLFLTVRLIYAATVVMVAIGARKQREAKRHWFLLTVALVALAELNFYGQSLSLPRSFNLGILVFQNHTLVILGLLMVVVVQMFRELSADRREKQRLAGELEAARSVQQLLFSGAHPTSAEYQVEAVYEPATEVGGDFYQVLAAGDDAILVVVGDVSGKGLKAALVVSMMTGVARAYARMAPSELLLEMSRVLGTGSGGFVTCLAVRCEPGGRLTMANAGHLNPLLHGAEVETEPGLPLGIAADVGYSETTLQLGPGEAITFVTDGIVEAASATGELFGFERTRALSGKSTVEIADAAKAWGQNDDITVVTVRRTG